MCSPDSLLLTVLHTWHLLCDNMLDSTAHIDKTRSNIPLILTSIMKWHTFCLWSWSWFLGRDWLYRLHLFLYRGGACCFCFYYFLWLQLISIIDSNNVWSKKHNIYFKCLLRCKDSSLVGTGMYRIWVCESAKLPSYYTQHQLISLFFWLGDDQPITVSTKRIISMLTDNFVVVMWVMGTDYIITMWA